MVFAPSGISSGSQDKIYRSRKINKPVKSSAFTDRLKAPITCCGVINALGNRRLVNTILNVTFKTRLLDRGTAVVIVSSTVEALRFLALNLAEVALVALVAGDGRADDEDAKEVDGLGTE